MTLAYSVLNAYFEKFLTTTSIDDEIRFGVSLAALEENKHGIAVPTLHIRCTVKSAP